MYKTKGIIKNLVKYIILFIITITFKSIYIIEKLKSTHIYFYQKVDKLYDHASSTFPSKIKFKRNRNLKNHLPSIIVFFFFFSFTKKNFAADNNNRENVSMSSAMSIYSSRRHLYKNTPPSSPPPPLPPLIDGATPQNHLSSPSNDGDIYSFSMSTAGLLSINY